MNYWYPGSSTWEFWRKYFKLTPEEAIAKWIIRDPGNRNNFLGIV